MTNYPRKVQVSEFTGKDRDRTKVKIEVDGKEKWVVARGMGLQHWTQRWKCAWAVFTGKADALFWEGQ